MVRWALVGEERQGTTSDFPQAEPVAGTAGTAAVVVVRVSEVVSSSYKHIVLQEHDVVYKCRKRGHPGDIGSFERGTAHRRSEDADGNAECHTFLDALRSITLIDCGRQAITDDAITISHTDLLVKYASGNSTGILTLPRGQVIELLISCVSRCVADLLRTTEIHGIIGAGGSGGTSLISAVMRTAAPIGLPKLIVSTVASGNTGPVVGKCGITLMYSVVDIAGTNRLLHEVLGNAAGAMFGMAFTYQHRLDERRARSAQENRREEKTRVGIPMFGVTTPCVDHVRKHLEDNYSVEVYVFHATGHGGKAMERLVGEGRLDAILDITTTEICDLIAGGTMSCETSRLEMTLKRGIPNIISVGSHGYGQLWSGRYSAIAS
ncbi:hypothetical protein N7472_003697 [Penicillium cf. griseofulvum]|uniref:Uncharacterized protein n=1 Tax=Penicillium cf. griseofulvum TaxID=2972120 RepID=A0A9W9MTU7_9EURO|nr:hypothetical protein N7472_003697 [Penicillium cf. griseofulvum]